MMGIKSSNEKKYYKTNESISKNFTLNAVNCFKLSCYMRNMPGYSLFPGYLVIPEVSKNERTKNMMRMFGQIEMRNTSVLATCYVNINDALFTFMTASNTFTQSDVLKCNVYPNTTLSIGLALTYVLSTLSVIKGIHYFHQIYNSKINKSLSEMKDDGL
jgi:hypothetical protein